MPILILKGFPYMLCYLTLPPPQDGKKEGVLFGP